MGGVECFIDILCGGKLLGTTDVIADPLEPMWTEEFDVREYTEGDKLEFKVGDASAGTFSVSDLPNNDATLLLVIHRHDTLSTAVAFESHVFANLANAQVAVIDTYKGKAQAVPKIKDEAGSNMTRSEELRYNSVVAVNEGKYRVSLDDAQGLEKEIGRAHV